MRGRFGTQPFLVEIKKGAPACRPNGIFLLPRWATRSPPHQSPSVTASPQGEASGLCSPTRKKRSKSGYVHGYRTSPSTGTMRPTTPKRASGNERAINPGGQGACPRPSFSPFLGRNGDPAGQAGPPGRCAPRHRKSPDHPKGTQYPTAPPARDRAGTHVAGSNLQRSQKGPPTDSRGPRPHLGDPTGPTLRRSGRDPLSSEKDPKPLGGLGSFPRLLYRCCWGNRNPHPWSQAKRRTLLASTWPPPS